MMEVILLERIEKLGQMGDVVRVRPGFARNYLLPQRKALRATKENMARFETQRSQLEAQNLQRREEAAAVAAKLEGLATVLLRQASESGQLYGSVTARDIAEAVTEAGFTIQKSQVALNQPIKELGVHAIRVVLHPEVSVNVSVNVAKSAEEAQAQVTGHSPERQEAEQAFAAASQGG
jgi:large subunit ribosomal protein L9